MKMQHFDQFFQCNSKNILCMIAQKWRALNQFFESFHLLQFECKWSLKALRPATVRYNIAGAELVEMLSRQNWHKMHVHLILSSRLWPHDARDTNIQRFAVASTIDLPKLSVHFVWRRKKICWKNKKINLIFFRLSVQQTFAETGKDCARFVEHFGIITWNWLRHTWNRTDAIALVNKRTSAISKRSITDIARIANAVVRIDRLQTFRSKRVAIVCILACIKIHYKKHVEFVWQAKQ